MPPFADIDSDSKCGTKKLRSDVDKKLYFAFDLYSLKNCRGT